MDDHLIIGLCLGKKTVGNGAGSQKPGGQGVPNNLKMFQLSVMAFFNG
jgi:hypothetical protein